MSRISAVLWAVFLIGVIFIGGFFFKLRPQYIGKVMDAPTKDSTEVLFDKYGIPHIYARTEFDAYAALGYVHAQERLFQMELMKRVGAGRLAEVLGSPGIEPDKLFRRLGINVKADFSAQKLKEQIDAPWLKMSEAYLSGINSFIDNGPTPLEYRTLGIPKEHFTIKDMYLIAGYMSYSFGLALNEDPLLTHIRDFLGEDYLQDLHIPYEPGSQTIPVYNDNRPVPTLSNSGKGFSLESLPIPILYGSNSWVISPKNTENGKVLFANDTHIGYSQPSTWFEAHIEYPGYSFYGNFMAGIPFALVGHTKERAWGATMFLNDDMDLYCEKLSPNGQSYYFNGQTRALNIREEVIHVKDSADINLQVKKTHHGPIITESVVDVQPNDEISCQWTFLDTENNLIEAFYRLNHSRSMDDSRYAVSLISAPGLNISYGDKEGNIAMWTAAKLAIRPEHVNPLYIQNGETGDCDLIGYMDFDDNPHMENPPWGYVYSANNAHYSSTGEPYPGYYEPDYRASVITEKISARVDWTMEAMKKLSMETLSKDHKFLSRDLIQLMSEIPDMELSEDERSALRQVKEWDGEHRIEELGPSVYYRWLYHIVQMSMEDELGEERLKHLLKANFIKSSIKELICNEHSIWWDDVLTEDDLETRGIIVQRAFKKTIKQMEEFYGPNQEEWQWGRYHQTLHKHLFNGQGAIDWAVNVGPFPSPGGIETINNSMFYLSDEPVVYAQHGPQMRILIDFSDVENSVSISPTGQSGVVMSRHYADQAEMYLKGAFRPQHMNRSKIERESTSLLFIPSE